MILNLNASSLKLVMFIAPVERPWTGNATMQPITPPTSASAIDSARNAVTMRNGENPSARNVPISRVRYATAAYIVLTAPKIAPIERITVTNVANTRSTVPVVSDCPS